MRGELGEVAEISDQASFFFQSEVQPEEWQSPAGAKRRTGSGGFLLRWKNGWTT